MARHQDCDCAATAGHVRAVPLQHAWLYGEEDAGRLRRRQGVVEKMRKDGKKEVWGDAGGLNSFLLLCSVDGTVSKYRNTYTEVSPHRDCITYV